MSLPTYIRKRKFPRPQDYLTQALGIPVQQVDRFLQEYKKWQESYEGFYINPTKRHVRPFWLLPKLASEQAITLQPAGMAGDRVQGIGFEVDTQGHFEIAYAMFTAQDGLGNPASNFLVEIFDGGNNLKGLQNTELHAVAVAGTAKRPFIWPETYFLNTQNAPRTLFMNFRNLSNVAITIRWGFHGRRWYHLEAAPEVQRAINEKFERMEKTYTYFLTLSLNGYPPSTPEGANAPGITLAAGETLQENSAPFFWATNEADTEIHKLTYFSTGPFEFQLREAESGRTLSNGWVQVNNGWGDGEFPFVLPETFLMERNYKVLFEVHDLSGATNVIYPVLTGRRLQYA
jgi:hypothetical protein